MCDDYELHTKLETASIAELLQTGTPNLNLEEEKEEKKGGTGERGGKGRFIVRVKNNF